ncbi:MAG: SAM-dependent methyltransferase [Phycisphaeraceae bacterium]|nr:SAM-dependent methyltransferase [Phycisphaeraceae bacterium]
METDKTIKPKDRGKHMDRADYWNNAYQAKSDEQLSWYQPQSTLSLQLIDSLKLPSSAAIMDVGGGGPSALAGELLDRGFAGLSILDVSHDALERCRQRLGKRADQVTWLHTDITHFIPTHQYDLWHDRAVFHFLTTPADQATYIAAMQQGVKPAGHAIIATFAPDGPMQCSGLDVMRWSAEALAHAVGHAFVLVASIRETHQTPWGKPQAFTYCLFQRRTK